jgi:hypothetical protein
VLASVAVFTHSKLLRSSARRRASLSGVVLWQRKQFASMSVPASSSVTSLPVSMSYITDSPAGEVSAPTRMSAWALCSVINAVSWHCPQVSVVETGLPVSRTG